jgi:hypothetical protein
MLKDLPNKFSIEDVLGVMDELGTEYVDYVYLPLSVFDTKKRLRETSKSKSDARNKAYCFVHISDVAASEVFLDRLTQYKLPNENQQHSDGTRLKKMHASLSSTQGVAQNLLRLMDIHNRKWHPRAGALALRLGNSLVPVHVASLRKFLQDVLKDHPETAPGCLQKQCTFSSSFDTSTSGISCPNVSAGAA